jgi:hypothetical protein
LTLRSFPWGPSLGNLSSVNIRSMSDRSVVTSRQASVRVLSTRCAAATKQRACGETGDTDTMLDPSQEGGIASHGLIEEVFHVTSAVDLFER